MSILVKNNIHWVGQRDWEVRDFHGTEYKTLRGSSYNSYLWVAYIKLRANFYFIDFYGLKFLFPGMGSHYDYC